MNRPLPTCDYPKCKGHLAKFESCLSEALYYASLQGFDETTGSTEAYGHFALMIFKEATLSVDVVAPNNPIMIPAGNYIVQSAESGAVYLLGYETETEARERFDKEDEAYGDWLDENEPE